MNQTKTQPDLHRLLSTGFMDTHTKYPTMQALFDALSSSFGDNHRVIKQWELDFFIRMRTPFASWSDMVNRAERCYAKQAA